MQSYTVHRCPNLVKINSFAVTICLVIKYSCSESSSISPLGKVVVSNGNNGFDLYSLGSGAQECSVAIPPGSSYIAAPVRFIHGGFAFVGGGLSGDLRFWDVDTGARVQNMKHGAIIIPFASTRSYRVLRSRANYTSLRIWFLPWHMIRAHHFLGILRSGQTARKILDRECQ